MHLLFLLLFFLSTSWPIIISGQECDVVGKKCICDNHTLGVCTKTTFWGKNECKCYSFGSEIFQLILNINFELDELAAEGIFNRISRGITGLITRPTTGLDAYNKLRSYFPHLPKVNTISEINRYDLENLSDEILAHNIRIQLNADSAEEYHHALIKEAQDIIGYENKIIVVDDKERDFTGGAFVYKKYYPYMKCSDIQDLDLRLFVIYHELGHLVNKDYVNYSGQDLQMRSDYYRSVQSKLDNYITLAKKTINDSSNIGKKIIEGLKKTNTFWNPPKDKEEYQMMLQYRGKEQSADLFSLEWNYRLKHLNSIFAWVEYMTRRNYYIVEGNEDKHPSDLERALYCLGFLIEQGIDINKALANWEQEGICTSIYPLSTQYLIHAKPEKTDHLHASYESYKKQKLEIMLSQKIDKVIKYLINDGYNGSKNEQILFIYFCADEVFKDFTNLDKYNMIRIINNLDIARNENKMDKKWLQDTIWMNWQNSINSLLRNNPFNNKIELLIEQIYIYHQSYGSHKIPLLEKLTIYFYNSLADLLQLPHVTTIQEISSAEIEKLIKSQNISELRKSRRLNKKENPLKNIPFCFKKEE